MNWVEQESGGYCPLYYEFIVWYRERVHGKVFYGLTSMKAKMVDDYLSKQMPDFDKNHVFEQACLVINETPIFTADFNRKSPRVSTGIVDKSEWVCVYCGEWAATVDHLIALDLGGTNNKENLAKCCYACNHLKGNKTLGNFYEEIEALLFQAQHFNNEKQIGQYGFMLFNIQKQIDYADANYALMYSPKKTNRINYKTIHKRVDAAPSNMSEILLNPKKKAALIADKSDKIKYVTNIIPPAPKVEIPNYLDLQIQECRGNGFDKLWKYELTLSIDEFFRPIYKYKTHDTSTT
jgi:hypothetical protein